MKKESFEIFLKGIALVIDLYEICRTGKRNRKKGIN